MQVPAAVLQHAPEIGQVLGVHVPPLDQSLLATLHPSRVRRKQVPVTKLQQRPEGCGQMFGLQVPASDHVAVQMDCSEMMQVPPVAQQAPGCGQMLGECRRWSTRWCSRFAE